MKFILTNSNHQPSAAFAELVEQSMESLREDLRIDEAHVRLEHHSDASPAFRITAHLVFGEAVDHTLRAALTKLVAELESRIDHRHQKRERRARSHFKTSAPTQLNTAAKR
jgi:ribosome-associated translation inhibitor RaiA